MLQDPSPSSVTPNIIFSESFSARKEQQRKEIEQLLCVLAANGNSEEVEKLLANEEVNINATAFVDPTSVDNKPTVSAIKRGYPGYPVCNDAISECFEATPLFWAAFYGRAQVVKLLLDKGAENSRCKVKFLGEKTEEILTSFDAACYLYHTEVIKHFVNKNKKCINQRFKFHSANFSILNKALRNGDVDFTRWLLDNEADIGSDFYYDSEYYFGARLRSEQHEPLYIAVSNNQQSPKETIALLELLMFYRDGSKRYWIDANQLMDIKSLEKNHWVKQSWNLLHYVAWNPSGSDAVKTKILHWLFDNSEKISLRFNVGDDILRSPVHLAIKAGNMEAIKLFALHNEYEIFDEKNYCYLPNFKIRYFSEIKYRCRPKSNDSHEDEKNYRPLTAFDVAVVYGQPEVVQFFVDKKWATVDQFDAAEIARGLLNSIEIGKGKEFARLMLPNKDLVKLNLIFKNLLHFISLDNALYNNVNVYRLDERVIPVMQILIERGASPHQIVGHRRLCDIAKAFHPDFYEWLLGNALEIDANKAERIKEYFTSLRGEILQKDWKLRHKNSAKVNGEELLDIMIPKGAQLILNEIEIAEKQPTPQVCQKTLCNIYGIFSQREKYHPVKQFLVGQDSSTRDWYSMEKNEIDLNFELLMAVKSCKL